jgi:hypothetical protein
LIGRKGEGVSYTILGKTEGGAYITLSTKARTRGLYCIGRTGTGKTTFLVNQILQDIALGHGVIFLEPHGDATLDVLSRIPPSREKDVILLDPSDTAFPFGLNSLVCPDLSDPALVDRTNDRLMHVFKKLWGPLSDNPSWGPQLENVLSNCLNTLIENQGTTLAEVPLLLRNEAARANLLMGVTRPWAKWFWEEDYGQWSDRLQHERTESTLNKVLLFLTKQTVSAIVGQATSTINFREIMDQQKILLIRLPIVTVGEDVASLLGTMLIAEVLNAALSRIDIPEADRKICCLYCDEFQRFATPDMASILAEARKFNLCATIAHQFRSQLDHANLGATLNVGNIVVFQVLGQDGKDLASQFDCTPPPPEIIGSNPIFTYKQDVTGHLKQYGHQNTKVVRRFNKIVAPIMINLEAMRTEELRGSVNGFYPDYFTDNGIYIVQTHDLRAAINKLNKLFFDAMSKKVSLNSPQYINDIVSIVIDLRSYLGFHPTFLNFSFAEGDDANDWVIPVDSETKQAIWALIKGYLDQYKFEAPPSGAASPDMGKVVLAQGFAKALKLRYKHARFRIKERWFDFPKPTDEEIHIACLARAQAECERVLDFITCLDMLCYGLQKEPIQVDSGQHEPRYGPVRTYQDMENEVATKLSSLDPYTAWVKVIKTVEGKSVMREYALQTLPLQPGISEAALTASFKRIQKRTRKLYCKPRAVVAAQILDRQQKLLKNIQTAPSTRSRRVG